MEEKSNEEVKPKEEKPKEEAKQEEKKEKKALSRIEKIMLDINKNYSELNVTHGIETTPFIEKIKTYYQIKQLEFQKTERIIMIILTLTIVGLTGLNIWLFNENNRIVQSLYLIPNYASLDPIWMETQGSFSQRELSQIGDQVTRIRICFYNEGRAPTGHIYATWGNESYFMAGSLNIDNILGGETNCSSDLILLNKKTTINSTTNELISNEETLPLGNYTLKLYVYCEFCIKNKTPIVDIPICIWGKNYSSTNCEWTKKRIW